MVKQGIIILLFSTTTILGYSQRYSEQDFIETTIKAIEKCNIINQIPIIDSLGYKTIFINTNGLISTFLDTAISKDIHLFFTGSKEDMFFHSQNYWFETINFKKNVDRINYKFCTNSFNEIDTVNYQYGDYIFQKENDNWIIKNHKIEKISFSNISKLDQPLIKGNYDKKKKKHKYCFNFRKKDLYLKQLSSLSDTIIGNWQSIDSLNYVEMLFYKDTIYSYSTMVGGPHLLSYKIRGNQLIYSWFNGEITSQINVIDINTIHITGIGTLFYEQLDPEVIILDYMIYRIPKSEYTLDKVKCWKTIETKKFKTRNSYSENKYYKEFRKREHNLYEEKNAL